MFSSGVVSYGQQPQPSSTAKPIIPSIDVSEDVAFALRHRAWRMAGVLIYCGMSPDEARRLAMHKMPGMVNVSWWSTDLLPKFAPEQQQTIRRELQRFTDELSEAGDRQMQTYIAEIAICNVFQKEKHLSDTATFNLWQAGLGNQTNQWWQQQLNTLSATGSAEVRRMLGDLPKARKN